VKFVHVYNPSHPWPGVTIAYEVAQLEQEQVVSLGASFSSPKDTYAKTIGRTISGQRLRSQPLQFMLEKEDTELKAHRLISMLHAFALGTEYEVKGNPLRPSRFQVRCAGKLIGPDGQLLRVEFDANENSVGWMNRIPRWTRTFLGDPP